VRWHIGQIGERRRDSMAGLKNSERRVSFPATRSNVEDGNTVSEETTGGSFERRWTDRGGEEGRRMALAPREGCGRRATTMGCWIVRL
jgi:hypothetical protein